MVFPIRDDDRDIRSVAYINYALIAANIFVFVVLQGLGANAVFTYRFSTVPLEIVTGQDVITNDRIVQDARTGQQLQIPGLQPTPIPVYLTILTSMFMHGGIAHLLGNLWFLWIFGNNIEDDLGHVRYVAFYVLCGIIASLCHVALNANGPAASIPSLGASGAISGVMGAYLVLHTSRPVQVILVRMMTVVPGWVAVGLWFLFQVISGLGLLGGSGAGGVAYGAHIGGFIAGVVLAWPFMVGRPRRSPRPDQFERTLDLPGGMSRDRLWP
jgi:membrane associated rhomboid family serine protease